MSEIAPRISVDPAVRFGKPVITGTRVPIDLVVGKLAAGHSIEYVATDCQIEREDVLAAMKYAASIIANERAFRTN